MTTVFHAKLYGRFIVIYICSFKVIFIDAVIYADRHDILYEEFYGKLMKQKPKQNFYGNKNQKTNIFYIFSMLENHNL